jgi:hypothetical protein
MNLFKFYLTIKQTNKRENKAREDEANLMITSTTTADTLLPFNKIRINGIIAELRAYAYIIQEVTVKDALTKEDVLEKRAFLWYLDIVGTSREALKAIWAGMVNFPPQPAVLYQEYAQLEEDNEKKVKPIRVFLHSTGTGEWYWKQIRLEKALAHQGVLFPEKALPEKGFGQRKRKSKKKEASSAAEKLAQAEANQEFVLIRLAQDIESDPQGTIKRLYLQRLNNLTTVPLLKHWAEWLWQEALQNQMISPMQSLGCVAYLCSIPKEDWIAATIERGLTTGLISVTETSSALADNLPVVASAPSTQKVIVANKAKTSPENGENGEVENKIGVTTVISPNLTSLNLGKEKEAA